MVRPRVIIADDHVLVAEGVRRVLESTAEVVAIVHDGHALVKEVGRLAPDLAIADIAMPLLNGLEAGLQIRREYPRTKVLFLSMHADGATIAEAFRAGASGYLLKHSAPDELSTAISRVMDGNCYITPRIALDVIEWALAESGRRATQEPSVARQELTPRQREVLQLVAEGKTVKEIAAILGVSAKTVEFHKGRLMQTLGLRTTAELTRYALKNKILLE